MSEATTFTLIHGVDETEIEYMSPDDIAAREGGARGQFQERELLEDLIEYDIEGTVIDGGANVGNHTLFFLKYLTTVSHVISVEAHPEIAAVLEGNIERNFVKPDFPTSTSWDLVEAALAQPGKTECHLSAIPPGNAGRTHIVRGPGNPAKKMLVKCTTLDDIWKRHQRDTRFGLKVGLIKLDIEDSECEAIEGATQLLTDCRPLIVAEHHTSEQMHRFGSLVRPFGYMVTENRYEPRGETRIWRCDG